MSESQPPPASLARASLFLVARDHLSVEHARATRAPSCAQPILLALLHSLPLLLPLLPQFPSPLSFLTSFPFPLCLTAHFSFSPPLPPPTLCPYWTNQSHRPLVPFTFDGRPPFRNVSDHIFTRVSKAIWLFPHLAIQSNAWPIRE